MSQHFLVSTGLGSRWADGNRTLWSKATLHFSGHDSSTAGNYLFFMCLNLVFLSTIATIFGRTYPVSWAPDRTQVGGPNTWTLAAPGQLAQRPAVHVTLLVPQ